MSKWISVNDRLPDDDGEFLVVLCGKVAVREFNPWAFGGGENSFRWFECRDIPNYGSEKCESLGVTHWMPLLEPPYTN